MYENGENIQLPLVNATKSWAEEVELEPELPKKTDPKPLPPRSEVITGDEKVVTEYKRNENGDLLKVVRTYKITKHVVLKQVAQRKKWKKFGDSANDEPGPSKYMMIGEDVNMVFVDRKEKKAELSTPVKAKASIKCSICNGNHWSVGCPYRAIQNLVQPAPKSAPEAVAKPKGVYLPPQLRFAQDKMEVSKPHLRHENNNAVRVSNLPDWIEEEDIRALAVPFGQFNKIYFMKGRVSTSWTTCICLC